MSLGRLDHFEVIRFLGRGGMSDVYLARDTHLDCDVALKLPREDHAADPSYRARLLGEARVLARLDHPNIVGVLDCGEAAPDPPGFLWPDRPGPYPESVLYLALRYLEGRDLAAEMGDRPLPIERALDWTIQIGRGLEAAHAHGVIHRDLKPANIRVTPDGVLKILDFGLAGSRPGIVDSVGPTASMRRDSIVGTVGYMCPEQAGGSCPADQRCDLFSLGVILYELVTGRRPFEGDNMIAVLEQIATVQPAPMRRYAHGVPDELERIVGKLLRKDPARRYQTACEVVTDLEALPAARRSARPVSIPSRLRTWPPRVRPTAGALAVLAAALVAVAALPPLARWALPSRETVAVIDFENLTGDAALDRLAVGLGMDLVTSLTRGSRMNVVHSTLRDAEGKPIRDPARLRQAYGVQTVLLGSLRDSNAPGDLEVPSVHLEALAVHRNRVLWTEECQATGNLGLLRTNLVRAALAHFHGPFESEASSGIDAATRPVAAAEAYLRGMGYLADPDLPAARDSAKASFDRAVALDPGYGRALAGRARASWWIYARDHDASLLERAERDARLAVRSAPAEIDGRLALARILQERGHTNEAVSQLREVLARNDRLAEAHALLGSAYRKLGDMESARLSFQTAIALQPQFPNYHRGYGAFLLLSLADFAGAEREFQKVIELTPGENRGYEMLATAYTLECRYSEAIETFAKRPNPAAVNPDARSNMATAYYFSGHYEDALHHYLEAASESPNDGVTRMNLGDCYAHLGRREPALDAYRLAQRLLDRDLVANPDDPGLRANYVMSLAKSGDLAGARSEIGRHFPTGSARDNEVLHVLAKALALCGDRDRAVAALDTLVRGRSYPTCLLGVEDEFASLRDDARFRSLVSARRR